MSLSTSLFTEAIPLLEICQQLITPEIVLNCHDDNQAVLAILARGFSPKLRHLSKFHKINVASTCQAFNDPDINAEYIETLKQQADVLTKALYKCLLVGVCTQASSVNQDLKLPIS